MTQIPWLQNNILQICSLVISIPLIIIFFTVSFYAFVDIFAGWYAPVRRFRNSLLYDIEDDELLEIVGKTSLCVGAVLLITPVLTISAYLYLKGITPIELINLGLNSY